MLRQNKIFLILLTLSFITSIATKIYMDRQVFMETEVRTVEVLPQDILDITMNVQMLSLTKKIKPVNRGNFPIQIYRSSECNGAIALILLEKNAEGAAILAHQINRPLEEIFYIYDGHLNDEFPSFGYWFDQVLQSVYLQKQPKNILSSFVIGAAEVGGCNLLNTLNWTF